MSATRRLIAQITANPPTGWGRLFAAVPGRSGKTRCLLCGRRGYGPHGGTARYVLPAPWQAACIAGHTVQCAVCRRPFTGTQAIAAHHRCKAHHACCVDHTTVPEWANPFTAGAAA